MIRSLAGVCLVALAPWAAFGQETASPPAFEVASVKPSTEQDRVIGIFTYPGGRVTVTNYTLKMLIHEAYVIEDYKILGGPHWTETERYNLEAKPAASSTLSKWVPASSSYLIKTVLFASIVTFLVTGFCPLAGTIFTS